MKIFFRLDECVSHRIADAAKTIGIPQHVKFETPEARQETGMKDVPWMVAFAKRGKASDKRVVFSCDRSMRTNEVERAAAETAGLIVFYAPKFDFWRHLHRLGQAAYFLRWFDRMVAIAATAPAGAQYQLPSSFSASPNLKQLPSVLKDRAKPPGRPRRPRPTATLI